MKKKIIIKPDMEWQVKEYSRTQDFHFTLPYQFLLLCKLVDTPPQRLLINFMDNLSCSSWKRTGRDQAKGKPIEYFLDHGYGQNYYSPEDLRQVFKEMDAVGLLFPNDDGDMIDAYAAWREKHCRYWFKKWFGKYRRVK